VPQDSVSVPEQINKVSMRYLILLFLLAVNGTLMARQSTLITGKVIDKETRESLPSATIQIEGTYTGTISNPAGDFSIQADKLPVWLHVRYIGYQTANLQISHESSFPVIIEMERSLTELGEIVVTDRDPGLSIMERVIARKQIWRNNLQNYRVDAFTRQVLSSDTSIVSISESNSLLYWDKNSGYREIQLNRKQTLNLTADQNYRVYDICPTFMTTILK
jgi:hypothetical protein